MFFPPTGGRKAIPRASGHCSLSDDQMDEVTLNFLPSLVCSLHMEKIMNMHFSGVYKISLLGLFRSEVKVKLS